MLVRPCRTPVLQFVGTQAPHPCNPGPRILGRAELQHGCTTIPTLVTMSEELQPKDIADDAVILDVREQDEWDAGHAPNSVHIPLAEIPERLGDLPEGEPLPVVCRSGNRSSRAVQWLEAQGFEVANVVGGMKQWEFDGKPVVTQHNVEPTVI